MEESMTLNDLFSLFGKAFELNAERNRDEKV